jgi:hypothetical protein
MANNSTNINKTKECLNSDGQQFHQISTKNITSHGNSVDVNKDHNCQHMTLEI